MTSTHHYIKVDIFFVRNFLAWLLLVIGLLLAPLAVSSFWLRLTILDTNQFVRTLGPLSENPAVVKAIAANLSTNFFENVDTEGEIRKSLPEKAQFLAPTLNAQLKVFVGEQATNIITTKEFNALWVKMLELTHPRVVSLLTGDRTLQVNDQGKVVLDFSSTIKIVNNELYKKGIYIFSNANIDPQIVFFESEKLLFVKHVFNAINFWGWFLPALSIICLTGAVGLSTKKLRFSLWLGLGLVIAMGILMMLVNLGQNYFVSMSGDLGREAAEALFAVITRPLMQMAVFAATFGVIVSAMSFIMPKTRFFRHKAAS